jgi:hypothetical protein
MSVVVRFVAIVALICGATGAALVALAQPAPPPQVAAAPTAAPTQVATIVPSHVPMLRLRVEPLLPSPSPTEMPLASATAQPSPAPSATPPPTATRIPQVALASFALSAGDMRYNIEVALNANGGALRRVVIAPGDTFSFNAALGPRPTRLPWRLVGRQPATSIAPRVAARFTAFQVVTPTLALPDSPFAVATAAPDLPAPLEAPTPPPAAPPEAPTATATATAAAEPVLVLGGGVCDLASRYVVAGRKLLPTRAFRFRQHPGGVAGVKRTDAVSIWATGGGPSDNDLLITNTSPYYLVFEAHVDRRMVTVLAWFQEGP